MIKTTIIGNLVSNPELKEVICLKMQKLNLLTENNYL